MKTLGNLNLKVAMWKELITTMKFKSNENGLEYETSTKREMSRLSFHSNKEMKTNEPTIRTSLFIRR